MPRKGRKSRKTNEFIDVKKSGPEQWDQILYVHPKKLTEPCARIESDGEWFPIDRVLDSIYIVGTDKMWQHLVQWKPCWSRQVTPSALRDFHGRATVLGCVVKEEILRSRARQRVEWNRREFMCSNFMVRITDPDGTSSIEVMPYPDVKRRFPTALFEFLEKKMPNPRVRDEERPRTDGLLSLYDDITVAECVNIDPDAPKILKKETKEEVKENGEGGSAEVPSLYKVGLEMKKKNKKLKAGKARRKSRVLGEIEHPDAETSSDVTPTDSLANDSNPLKDVLNTTPKKLDSEEFKRRQDGSPEKSQHFNPPPGVSPNSAKEFLNKLHPSKKSSSKMEKSVGVRSPSRRRSDTPKKVEKKSITPRSHRSNKKDTSVSYGSDDDVVVIEEENEVHPAKKSSPTKDEAHTAKKSSPTKTNEKKSPAYHPNGKRASKGTAISPGDKANANIIDGHAKTPSALRIRSPRLSSGGNSAKRTSTEGKSRGCKRAAPLRSRNSLDNYFGRDHFKHRRLSGEENGPKLRRLSGEENGQKLEN